MAKERTVVRAVCIRNAQADYNYYNEGQEYLLDLEWAESKGMLKHFKLVEEVKQEDAEEEVRDGMIIKKKQLDAKHAKAKATETEDPADIEAAEKAAEEAAEAAKGKK